MNLEDVSMRSFGGLCENVMRVAAFEKTYGLE
jgi:hypothetical protein